MNRSFWPKYGTLPGTTTPIQCGRESKSNEEVLQIPESSRIRGSPSDILVLYPKYS